jgi:hypothetical protein
MKRLAARPFRALAVAALVLSPACGGGDGGPTGETGSIQISLTPPAVSVQQGGSGTFAVSLTRGGGFSGTVTLSVAGLPAGVTTRITPPQLTGSAASATVEVTAAANAPAGAHTATVTATAAGAGPATATASVTVTAPPAYALRLTPAALTIVPGTSGEAAVAIDRTNFSADVALTLLNAPAGVTGAFTPASTSGNSSALVVSVGAAVLPGSYSLTVQGSAAGLGVRTAPLALTVPAPPSYTLNLNPAALTVQRGGGAEVSVTLARTNFTGAVALSLAPLPPGITATLTPPSTTGTSAQLSITVGANVSAGFYQLSVRGSATGLVDRVAFLQLNVTAGQPGGGNVEYQFCDASVVPVFFAYQDGSAAWQVVSGFTSGGTTTFSFNLAQGRGGVLAVFRTVATPLAVAPAAGAERTRGRTLARRAPDGLRTRAGVTAATGAPARASAVDVYLTEVLYGTTAELAQDGTDYCALTQPTKTVTGTVAGLPFGQFGIVSLGPSTELFIAGTSLNPVTFSGVPLGPVDFVGTRMPAAGAPPDKVLVFRDVDAPSGGSLPATIDFNGTAAVAPAVANATITGGGGDDLEIFTELVTANATLLMWFDLQPTPVATRPWAGLPASETRASDFHGLYAFATSPANELDYRASLKYVGAVADQGVSLGPVLSPPTATQVAAGEYPRFRFQGSIPAAYDKGASVDVVPAGGSGNVVSILATGAWLAASGSATTYDLTMPDVAALSGFPLASRLAAGENDVAATAFGFTGSGVFDPRPALGGEYRSATRSGAISVP